MTETPSRMSCMEALTQILALLRSLVTERNRLATGHASLQATSQFGYPTTRPHGIFVHVG